MIVSLLVGLIGSGALLLAGVGGYVLMALRRQRALRAVADELGLMWRAAGPFDTGEVLGDLDGFAVTVRLQVRGIGSLARQAMAIEVAMVPALPFAGEVRKEDSVTRAASSIGAADLVTGDGPFDEMFRLDVDDLADFLELFDEDLRRASRAFAAAADDVLLLPSRLRWFRFDPSVPPEEVVHATRATVVLADLMRRRRGRIAASQRPGDRRGPSVSGR